MGGIYKVNKTSGELSQISGGTLYADLPIGSWVKNDMTPMPTGFLKYGDTISPTEHPELYAKYGSTVPYMTDTSELSDYENITISASSSSPTVMSYDGYLTVTAIGGDRSIYINGLRPANAAPSGSTDASTTVAVKKGDQVYFSSWYSGCCLGAFYKKSLIVKAKNVGVPTNFSDAIQRVTVSTLKTYTYPANYSAIGTIFTGNTIRGYGKADVTLYPNGIARVDYAIEITTSYVANEFGYGISPDALHTINSNIPLITPATPDPKGNYLWFINGASGIIKRSSLGYSSAHGRVNYEGKLYWQLGRIYNTSATYGGWPTSEFAVGDYITGTCWGTFSV